MLFTAPHSVVYALYIALLVQDTAPTHGASPLDLHPNGAKKYPFSSFVIAAHLLSGNVDVIPRMIFRSQLVHAAIQHW